MNENIEKQEFINVMKAMDEEEQKAAVKVFDTDVLWDEIRRREQINREMVSGIRKIVRVE